MSDLLGKTRKINRFFQDHARHPVNFRELAQVLADELNANVCIVSRKGKSLGCGFAEGFDDEAIQGFLQNGETLADPHAENLLRVVEPLENIRQKEGSSLGTGYPIPGDIMAIIPVYSGVERLGTLLLSKFGDRFSDEELMLAECAATMIGMEILRSKAEEDEAEARKRTVVKGALDVLSFSEEEALRRILRELNGKEGLLVAGRIADEAGITRSVVVNALKKLESAGVLEARSLGMKGTHIRILNDKLIPEMESLRPYDKVRWA